MRINLTVSMNKWRQSFSSETERQDDPERRLTFTAGQSGADRISVSQTLRWGTVRLLGVAAIKVWSGSFRHALNVKQPRAPFKLLMPNLTLQTWLMKDSFGSLVFNNADFKRRSVVFKGCCEGTGFRRGHCRTGSVYMWIISVLLNILSDFVWLLSFLRRRRRRLFC